MCTGMATFFTYKGVDGNMEEGFTEHSGCPVRIGEKWITTQWMREGVSVSDSHHGYDPIGNFVEKSEEIETEARVEGN